MPMQWLYATIRRAALAWAIVCGVAAVAVSSESASPADTSSIQPTDSAEVDDETNIPDEHPLLPALKYATARYQYIRRHVRDYRCLLVKRERIKSRLQDYQFIETEVRRQGVRGGRIVTPLSVFMRFLAPRDLEGRKALFVAGRNDGKMIVRKGGQRFSYVTVNVDPEGETALRDNLLPITEVGFDKMMLSLIGQIKDDMQADPAGSNTLVKYYLRAKINDRVCTHIRVTHPTKQEGLQFYMGNVYIDDELHVPIRVDGYDWPEADGEPPELVAEYTYLQLILNVGLTDSDFTRERVE